MTEKIPLCISWLQNPENRKPGATLVPECVATCPIFEFAKQTTQSHGFEKEDLGTVDMFLAEAQDPYADKGGRDFHANLNWAINSLFAIYNRVHPNAQHKPEECAQLQPPQP